ncbi:MAG TPA: cytidylate kinase-like family protein [Candidatus Limnocylindrales bacterium]|nr:cytidylate kinase-like family protein [Candidatus Limnocylindrales bacterium]
MRFHTVCISFTQESDGERIGQMVAAALGFRFVDEEIIFKAADLAGVEPERVAAAEQKPPLLERVLGILSSVEPLVRSSPGPGRSSAASSDELRDMIRAAIHEVGKLGNVVIVAHGASMALAGTPGVLRVLVTAPEEVRIDRHAERRMLTRVDASESVTSSDDARRDYFQSFYKIEDESPTRYDLVLNTELLSAELATRLIVAAALG